MSSKLENNKLTLDNVEITSDLLIPSFTFQSVNVTNTSTSVHLNMDEGYEYVVFKDGNIVDIDISENVTLEVGKYADFLVLKDNPLKDVSAVEQADKQVYQHGERKF